MSDLGYATPFERGPLPASITDDVAHYLNCAAFSIRDCADCFQAWRQILSVLGHGRWHVGYTCLVPVHDGKALGMTHYVPPMDPAEDC